MSLPDGWAEVPLAEIATKVGSGATPKGGAENYAQAGVPLIRSMNVVFFGFKRAGLAYLDDAQAAALANVEVRADDVLLNITGASIGRVTVAPTWVDGARVNQHVCIVRTGGAIEPRLLAAYLSSPAMQTQIAGDHYGMTRQALTKAQILGFFVPVPPINEQQRIADKLNTLLARIDACRRSLQRAALTISQFRQSVLSAALTGQLTATWRQQVSAASWTSVKLTAAGSIGRGKSRHRPRNDPRLYGGDYPFIQTGDIADAKDVLSTHRQTYSDFGLAQSKLWPKDTLCITIAANIADTAILGYPACFPDSVVGFVANPLVCDVRFVQWVIKVAKADLEREAPATAQRNINLATLEALDIELPSLTEQTEIVRRVSLLMNHGDRMEERLQHALSATNSLTSASLAKAFRGELVPQDPSDEPAQAMLDRLRAATSSSPGAAPKPRARRVAPA